MQKRLNRAIRISPEAIMKLAEELYQAGFISYPRTETDSFPPDFDYRTSVEALRPHPTFGFHADALAEGGRFELPRRGSNNDNAHPPIYPTKLMSEREYGTLRGKKRTYRKCTTLCADTSSRVAPRRWRTRPRWRWRWAVKFSRRPGR